MRATRSLWRRLPVLAVGLAMAAGLGAAAFGSQQLLPRPAPPIARAVAALGVLQRTPVGGSLEHLDSGPARQARCRSDERKRLLVRLAHGRRLLFVVGKPAARRPTLQRWAELQLAGCGTLLADELASALLNVRRTVGALGTFHGRRVFRITISSAPGRTMLLVSPTTLAPLAVQYRSPRLRGWSELLPPARLDWRGRLPV